jgi:hypothetical protein
MDLSKVNKALAGALVGLVVYLLTKFHIVLDPTTNDAVTTIANAVVTAATGFLVVYWSKANKK